MAQRPHVPRSLRRGLAALSDPVCLLESVARVPAVLRRRARGARALWETRALWKKRNWSLALLACSIGCFPTSDGLEPPLDRLYFPVGVALSAGGDQLYVASSNFDLQYNSGSLLVLDAKAIREHLPTACRDDDDCPAEQRCDDGTEGGSGATFLCVDEQGSPCGDLGVQSHADRSLSPGPCQALPLRDSELVLAGARIAPFATDLAYSLLPGGEGARVYVSVRGDATLHWADVRDDVNGVGPHLDCGQDNPLRRCDENHRRGNQSNEETPRGERMPTEPSWLGVSPDGEVILVPHQINGSISVFTHSARGPRLRDVLTGLGPNPMAVAAVPPPRLVTEGDAQPSQRFLVSFRESGTAQTRIELFEYQSEPPAGYPHLLRRGSELATINNPGQDARGIAVDASVREACEASCDADCVADAEASSCVTCLARCAAVPLDVYVANRSPASLLIGQTRPNISAQFTDDVPDLSLVEPLRGGPSRVVVGDVIGVDGSPQRRVFVLAFDARWMYVYDPQLRRVETRLATGRGPQGVAIDSARGLGYVVHFTDSFISVVDLDRRHATYGQVLMNVGTPTLPQSAN